VQPLEKSMRVERAAFFMRRFKSEEKLLGPNEQAALDFVIEMLTCQAQRTEPIQSLQCFHCQVTIETLNDKVMHLMAERKEEQNFCSRCGKRTNDIHTCTPPHD
jgi:hypothetical protein